MLTCNIIAKLADKITKDKYGGECDISDDLFSLLVNDVAPDCPEIFNLCEQELACSTSSVVTCNTIIAQTFVVTCSNAITITQNI